MYIVGAAAGVGSMARSRTWPGAAEHLFVAHRQRRRADCAPAAHAARRHAVEIERPQRPGTPVGVGRRAQVLPVERLGLDVGADQTPELRI
jgi:hypothetical protein